MAKPGDSETIPRRIRDDSETIPRRTRDDSETIPRRFRDDSETIPRRCKLVPTWQCAKPWGQRVVKLILLLLNLASFLAGFFLHTGAVQLRAAGSATVATVLYIAKLQFYLGKWWSWWNMGWDIQIRHPFGYFKLVITLIECVDSKTKLWQQSCDTSTTSYRIGVRVWSERLKLQHCPLTMFGSSQI